MQFGDESRWESQPVAADDAAAVSALVRLGVEPRWESQHVAALESEGVQWCTSAWSRGGSLNKTWTEFEEAADEVHLGVEPRWESQPVPPLLEDGLLGCTSASSRGGSLNIEPEGLGVGVK
ncbi:hypothetical protein ACFU7D_15020 [Nocardioides sp. NPDC057577]|uniref:hypothetical protein n=1 Tax=Nocardioides sp. NPDC057577 TaxID=3346171 RepID=UPI00366F95D3